MRTWQGTGSAGEAYSERRAGRCSGGPARDRAGDRVTAGGLVGELGGQVALVTGSTRGIGKAIAIALGGAGAKLIGTATTEGGATAISEYLGAANIAGRGMVLNV